MAAVPGADHDIYAALVDAAAQARDEEGLRTYAPLAEESAASVEHRLDLGIAHRAWGVAHTLKGEYAQAEQRLRKALEFFESYPAPWQIGRTWFELGELWQKRGETAKSRESYGKALEAFETLKAAPDVARTRLALESLGGRPS